MVSVAVVLLVWLGCAINIAAAWCTLRQVQAFAALVDAAAALDPVAFPHASPHVSPGRSGAR